MVKSCFIIGFILILYGCGGVQPIQQPASELKTDSVQDKREKELDGDDELLDLLAGKKVGKPVVAEKKDANLEVNFEPIKSDTIKKETVENLADKEIPVVMQPNVSALLELNKLDDRVKSLETNLDKKPVNKQAPQKKKEKITVPTKNSNKGTYESDYKAAYKIFQSRKYSETIKSFRQLIDRNPKHSLADNAQYWIGESNFAMQKYRQAILDFEKVITFPKSNKNEDAQFKIAYCYILLKDKLNSQIELQRFIKKYPKSRNLNRAKKMLKDL